MASPLGTLPDSPSISPPGSHDVPDIARERAQASFVVEELTHLLDGGAEATARKREVHDLVARDPAFARAFEDQVFLSREARYAAMLPKAVRKVELCREHGIGTWSPDMGYMREAISDNLCLDLHESMFSMTVNSQGTPEQVKLWGKLARNYNIIGTYAQTELGHGSALSHLETTATYIPATREFELHSPTLTSAKWWPGGLGKASTHCVVMARLVLGGRDIATHAFVVQLRRQDDHTPLPGVEVGDIGPKFGFSTQDNGFLRFSHVRVPREAMLMRFAQVTEEGQYKPAPHDKISYGTMIGIRSGIVRGAGRALGKAATIATRYSAVRRQFGAVEVPAEGPAPAGGGATVTRERQVLDYQTQLFKLMPTIAATYAFMFTGQHMFNLYFSYLTDMDSGDFSALPEVHATSSGLKALTTWVAADGIETCRRACGGHGYSLLSGLPQLYSEYVAAVTYEGENTLLYFQTARFLVKCAWASEGTSQDGLGSASKRVPPPGNAAYLDATTRDLMLAERCRASTSAGLDDADGIAAPANLVAAMRHRAARLAFGLAADVKALLREGRRGVVTLNDARDAMGQDFVRTARAHCYYVIAMAFCDAVDAFAAEGAGEEDADTEGATAGAAAAGGAGAADDDASPPRSSRRAIVRVLRDLCAFFCLNTVESELGEFVEDGYLSTGHVAAVRAATRALAARLRPDAVPLVDALDHSDFVLRSCLGRRDGRVYEALYAAAKRLNPLNRTEVVPGWEEHMQPLLTRTPWPDTRQRCVAPGGGGGGGGGVGDGGGGASEVRSRL